MNQFSSEMQYMSEVQTLRELINIRWYKDKYRLQHFDDTEALRLYFYDSSYWCCSPSIYFNSEYYLTHNPDVADAHQHPLLHYIRHGDREGRKPNAFFDPAYYKTKLMERGITLESGTYIGHFLRNFFKLELAPSLEFDAKSYLQLNEDLVHVGVEPLAHYLEFGKQEGRKFRITNNSGFIPDLPAITLAQSVLMRENPARNWFSNGTWFDLGQTAPAYPNLSKPLFSVIVPCWNSNLYYLQLCLSSVLMQSYRNFELIIVDDGSRKHRHRAFFRSLSKHGIKLVLLDQNQGISAASNAGAAEACGEWLLFLDHDDLLHPQALAILAQQSDQTPEVRYIFSDSAKISAGGEITSFHYKPNWDPILLFTYMYAGQLLCVQSSLFQQLAGFNPVFDGCQDHDLALRIAEAGVVVMHIPQVLYFWRAIPGSTALSAAEKPYAHEAAKKALSQSLLRREINARPFAAGWAEKKSANFFQLAFEHQGPQVSIIIPTRDNIDMLESLVDSIREKTNYASFHIMILGDAVVDAKLKKRMRKLDAEVHFGDFSDSNGRFSFSKKVNAGVKRAKSPYVLLLNDDTEVISSNWLSDMMGYAQMPGVAAVGAQLVYGDGSVQHAGITLGLEGGRAGHLLKGLPDRNEGYLSLRSASRSVFGVTAACLLIERDKYLAVNGFDEQLFPLAYNDVDFCARLLQRGWRNVYVATAILKHYEGVTRQRKDRLAEIKLFHDRYGHTQDHWFSKNWSSSEEIIYPLVQHFSVNRKGSGLLFVSHNGHLQGATKILCELAHLLSKEQVRKARFYLPSGEISYARIKQEFETGILNGTIIPSDSPEALAEKILHAEHVLAQANPEVVLCNTLLNLPVVLAAKRLGIHVLWLIHESEGAAFFADCHPQVQCSYLPQALVSADHVVFVSHDCRQHYREFDVAGNFSVIRNGINHPADDFWQIDKADLRQKMHFTQQDFVLLTVGTLCERKSQKHLVQLARYLEQQKIFMNLQFLIVGPSSGQYQEEMIAEVNKLTFYNTRFHFVGAVTDPTSYYRLADLFIFTSTMEAYPTVLCEALAHGLPILSTPVEGAQDIVFHQELGLLAPISQLDVWAEFIERMQDEKQREAYATAARTGAMILPQWEQVAESYRKLLPATLFAN